MNVDTVRQKPISEARIAEIIALKEKFKETLREELRVELSDRLSAQAGHTLTDEPYPSFVVHGVAAEIKAEGIKALLPLTELEIERAKEKMLAQFQADAMSDISFSQHIEQSGEPGAIEAARRKVIAGKKIISREEAGFYADRKPKSLDRWPLERTKNGGIFFASLERYLEKLKDED